MKHLDKITLLGAALLPFSIPAGALSLSTDPVGGTIIEIPAGISILSDSYLGEALFTGTVTGVSPDGLVVELPSTPAVQHPAYIHVLSGPDAGRISTILDSEGPFLTVETALDLAEGDALVIRKHRTLGELLPQGLGDGSTATFYNADGTIESATLLEKHGWLDRQSLLADDLILFPGEAVVVNASSPASVLMSGSVTVDPVKVGFGASAIAIVGSLNPVEDARLDDLFASAATENDTVTLYENRNGIFSVSSVHTFFEGHGFFTDAGEPSNTGVPVGGAAVLRSSRAGHVTLPPAFSHDE